MALLVTGKLACLLGALLVFAPQPIYPGGHHGIYLADQHGMRKASLTADRAGDGVLR